MLMKKYHLYLWIIALAGLITSCSHDDTDALPTDATDANRVTLTASLPADFVQPQPKSRALPTPQEGYKLRCILEVWNNELTTLKVRQEICPEAGATQIDFSFTLDEQGDYKALLWADYIQTGITGTPVSSPNEYTHYRDGIYVTDTDNGLKAVTQRARMRDYEKEDAFCAVKPFTKAATALNDLSATLSRPLCRLTIAEKNTTNFSYCKGAHIHLPILTTLNVATGELSNKETRETHIDNSLSFGTEVSIGGKSYKVLYTAYLFAPENGATMDEIRLESFTATDGCGKVLSDVTIPAGIPLKRNYRVNAAGNIIAAEDEPSTTVNMTVDINSEWTEPDEEFDIINVSVWDGTSTSQPTDYTSTPGTVNINTAAELAWLAELTQQSNDLTDYTFKLNANIDLDNHEWTPIGAEIYSFMGTFDGQGHTVSNMKCTRLRHAGLFGSIWNATVQNVTVSGNVSYNVINMSGFLGGIAGKAINSTITGCTNYCTISATGENPQVFTGGIVGYVDQAETGNTTKLTGNKNLGNVSTNSHMYATAGGIIGTANSSLSNTSVILTDNVYSDGHPSNVCIGRCGIPISGGTITIDGKVATDMQPFPVPQP